MEPVADNAPVIAVVGPTASGKTALAIELAKRFKGEIIAADSRTVYKGMDIGTAKPTPDEQAAIPHHLIDMLTPDTQFTVADFQHLARNAIAGIRARGNLPFLVGGTGLYIEAVLYNFSLRAPADPARRARLQKLSVEELQSLLLDKGIALPENERNPRHLVRTLETEGANPERTPLQPEVLIIGLDPGREVLRKNITRRVDAMVQAGFIEEARELAEQYGWDAPGLQAPGYRAFRPYLEGEISLEEAKRLFIQNDMQYAKRQKTWFKRNPDIHWISKTAEAVELVTTLLNK